MLPLCRVMVEKLWRKMNTFEKRGKKRVKFQNFCSIKMFRETKASRKKEQRNQSVNKSSMYKINLEEERKKKKKFTCSATIMSRRRSNRVKNIKHVTNSVAVTIIEDDCEEDEYAKHRSCWKHVAAFNMRVLKSKLTEEEFEIFKSCAPCYYDECTRHGRSERRMKCKYLVSKLRNRLNSKIFIGYLEDVWRGFPDEKTNSFVCLDALWFSMYKSEGLTSSFFNSVKAKLIFSKKYAFLPIVYWGHWNLLIFCNFGEALDSDTGNTCVLFLDSLKTRDSCQRFEPDIRKFVLGLYDFEGRTEDPDLVNDIPLYVPDVPQQKNGVECGSFVLYFIQRFIEDAPENFNVDHLPYFMKEDWFSRDDLEEFRKKLDSLGTIHGKKG